LITVIDNYLLLSWVLYYIYKVVINNGTDMLSSFKIGHYTSLEAATGCTVILPPAEITASACVCGASPGTRELALLSPERKISRIHALLLTGGSAFGLNAAQGIMEYLAKKNIGYQTNCGVVPIVPAAVIYDLNIGNPKVYPTPENAKAALKTAGYNNQSMGSVGAGTGASVGKWKGVEFAMKGGLGIAGFEHGGIKVTALTVVNSVGDIIEKNGQIIAGAVDKNNTFFAQSSNVKRWGKPDVGLVENTMLSVVMTNAVLSKQQAYYLAERAHFGIARRVDPSHTSYDGDITFVLAKPDIDCNIDLLANMAVEAVEQSIINGVKEASQCRA
jgi:L-aminopeptidase/D-esterase-like protein